jgi:hypothetical protein
VQNSKGKILLTVTVNFDQRRGRILTVDLLMDGWRGRGPAVDRACGLGPLVHDGPVIKCEMVRDQHRPDQIQRCKLPTREGAAAVTPEAGAGAVVDLVGVRPISS